MVTVENLMNPISNQLSYGISWRAIQKHDWFWFSTNIPNWLHSIVRGRIPIEGLAPYTG